jgi:acyl dehydratase
MKIFADIDEFAASCGLQIGPTDWIPIDQSRVNAFADATGDHQWIHVDEQRAATGPFGGTISHGFLTLSLLPVFIAALYRVDNVSMAINYGLDKVRFISPVRVGSNLRASTTIIEFVDVPGGVQGTIKTTVEIQDVERPACVMSSILRYMR